MRINRKNFKSVCGLNGLTPMLLSRKIKRHKTTVYRALSRPSVYGPTRKLIEEALPVREVPHA